MKSKWLTLGLLCLAYFFYMSDRMLFGLLVLPIQKDTGLSDLQIGSIDTVVYWTIALLAPVAGVLGDRFPRPRIITCAVVLWGFFTALTGFVGGIVGFIAVRAVLLTAAQSFYGPSAYAFIASEHRETRTAALSIHEGAMYVGMLLCGVIVSALLARFGSWRPVYFSYGAATLAVGLIFGVCCWRAGGVTASAKRSLAVGMKTFFGNPAALCIGSGFVAILFASSGFAVWAPKYMALKFGLSVGEAARGVMFWPNVAAMTAAIGGGFLTDALVRKYPRVRLVIYMSVFLAAVPVLAAIGYLPCLPFVWGAFVVFGLLRGLYIANSKAALFDVIPPECRASSVGFLNIIACFVSSLAPVSIGYASHRWGLAGFEFSFAAMGGLLVIAAALSWVAYRFLFARYRVVES